MNERLIEVMEHYGFSPSIFADEIGVLRSSISHILSGRNKPGLDLVQKVLARFPDLSAEWLMLGAGSMLKGAIHENGSQPEVAELPLKPKPADKLPLEYFIETSKRETGPKPDDSQPAADAQETKGESSHPGGAAVISPPESRPAQRSEPAQIQMAPGKSGKVKRITLYYDDNTFQDFFPG